MRAATRQSPWRNRCAVPAEPGQQTAGYLRKSRAGPSRAGDGTGGKRRRAHERLRRAATLDDVVAAHSAARLLQPVEQVGDLGRGDGEPAVGGTVIDAHLPVEVAPAAWKHDLVDIAETFVIGFRLAQPLIRTSHPLGRILEIEKGEAKPVDGAARRQSDPVIEKEP